MNSAKRLAEEHLELTRRYFLGLAAAGVASLSPSLVWASSGDSQTLADAIARLSYLTPVDQFKMFGRGNPPPDQLSPGKRREVGLDPETWRLEVVADPESDCKVENPLTKKRGTALDRSSKPR
jgi:hypothetical protein